MTQLKIPAQLARELTYCGRSTQVEEWDDAGELGIVAVIENRHTGEEKRWTSIHELVIKTADGKLWRRLYEVGLTENQDTRPFEYEGDSIPFDEVHPVPVETIEYLTEKEIARRAAKASQG